MSRGIFVEMVLRGHELIFFVIGRFYISYKHDLVFIEGLIPDIPSNELNIAFWKLFMQKQKKNNQSDSLF